MTFTKGKPAFRAGRDAASLAENMELLTGQRGDQLDRAITRRELAAMGLTSLRRVGNTYVPDGTLPGGGDGPTVVAPTMPRNVVANGAFHTILVEWDKPGYQGHSNAEIWRAEENNLSKAALVGTTAANLFSDAIGKDASVFYWVRFVNRNDVKGPWHGVDGVWASTSPDIQDILDKLQGEIEESHLTSELLGPIKKVPQLSEDIELGSVTSVEASLTNDIRDQENRKARGRIAVLQQVLADAHESLARLVVQLTADFETETDELRGQVTIEAKARADKDEALGELIETVTAKAGELESAVQTHSQAIAGLETGAQAMWSVKAQAGDITAGIGLIAKSDGTSQVAISASQVFVFNPNSSTPMAPLFAIDNGQAVIAEAIIRKATIQILTSEKITADYIKAGVSMSAPAISGGSIDMGNAFLSGGAAGFGKGGPYASWGFGWYTMIYADGSIYTNRLRAEGGYVKNMTLGNCTIEQDCVVKGTVFADRIVGDVYVARDYSCVTHEKQVGPIDVCSIKVNQAVGFARTLTIPGLAGLVGCSVTASGGGSSPISNSNSTTMQITVLMDGSVVKTLTAVASAYATSNPSQGPVTSIDEVGAYIGDITIPANREPLITIRIQRIRGDGWVRSDPSQSGRVVLFKQGSSLS